MDSKFKLPSFFHEVVLCVGAGCGAAIEVFTFTPMTDYERTNYVCIECRSIGNEPPAPITAAPQPPLHVERRRDVPVQQETLF